MAEMMLDAIAPVTNYDVGLAWNWEFDADFALLFEQTCQAQGVSLLKITAENIVAVAHAFLKRQLALQVFVDRASDTDLRFLPIAQWAREYARYRINPHEKALRTWDKTTMHLALVAAGLRVPYTIILPSYNAQPQLPAIDLSPLGARFIIKPSHGGGGDGVLMEVTALAQVLAARQDYPADKYLLQFHVAPVQLGTRPAWFRVIWCAGQIYPCWWDMQTHLYARITAEEEQIYALSALRAMTAKIAHLCELDLFSTEIALIADGQFVVVDYVNDQIDLRLQSKTPDGVPDELVQTIVAGLVKLIGSHRQPAPAEKLYNIIQQPEPQPEPQP